MECVYNCSYMYMYANLHTLAYVFENLACFISDINVYSYISGTIFIHALLFDISLLLYSCSSVSLHLEIILYICNRLKSCNVELDINIFSTYFNQYLLKSCIDHMIVFNVYDTWGPLYWWINISTEFLKSAVLAKPINISNVR